MRIGIDARMYGSQQTGIGTYVKQLTDAMFRMDKKNEYVLFLRDQSPNHPSIQSPNVNVIHVAPKWYSLREQFTLPYIFWRQKLDVLFVPHFNAPILYPGKFIVTIHDVTPLDFPARGLTAPWLKQGLFRFVAQIATMRASHVVAVSEFTKQQLLARFRMRADRITVIPEAPRFSKVIPDSSFFTPRFSLTPPYLLFVGVLRPHKNILGLLDAFAILRKQFSQLTLVLAGPHDPRYPEIKSRAEQGDVNGSVRFLGFVPDQDLPQLFANAACAVVPSFVEGFGLVGLEALVQGVPVVASRAGALPEVLQDAALYFDPRHPKNMAETISRILMDSGARNRILAAAPAVLSRYSWDHTAQETLRVLTR